MSIIKEFLGITGDNDVVYEHRDFKVTSEGDKYKFDVEDNRSYSVVLDDGEEYKMESGMEFSKRYLKENSAVVVSNALDWHVMSFGEKNPNSVAGFKFSKKQVENLDEIKVNGENYYNDSGDITVEEQSDGCFVVSISNFPDNYCSLSFLFEEYYPKIKFEKCNLSKLSEPLDLTGFDYRYVTVDTPKDLSGDVKLGKERFDLSDLDKYYEVPQTKLYKDIMLMNDFSDLDDKIKKWQNFKCQVKLLPDEYKPVEEHVLPSGQISFTKSDLQELAELVLEYPKWINDLSIKLRYHDYEEIPVGLIGKYRRISEKDGNTYTFSKIIPGADIRIHYNDNTRFNVILSEFDGLDPGERRVINPDIMLKKKKIRIRIEDEENKIIKVNDENLQINNEKSITVPVEDTGIEVKNIDGTTVYSMCISSDDIVKTKELVVSKDEVKVVEH